MYQTPPYYQAPPKQQVNYNDQIKSNDEIASNIKSPISSGFFTPKKQKPEEVRENVGPTGSSKSVDSLNVDLSKVGFNKKQGNTKDLLPSFITDNFKK